jgi:hypothetical protein
MPNHFAACGRDKKKSAESLAKNQLVKQIRHRMAIAVLLSTAVFGISPSYGFNNIGHMTVAGLAYDELSADQQKQLALILRHHPKLNFITDNFPNKNIPDRDLVMAAATWPDLARGHASKANAEPSLGELKNNGYEEKDPAIKQVRFDDNLLHPGWHFIDTPLWTGEGSAPSHLPAAPAVNAVGVVKVLIGQLKSNESDSERAYDFAWLMHLVGDLHQPLHCVDGISETFPSGDRGGNLIIITGSDDGERELHAFWDDILNKNAAADKKTHRPRLDKDVSISDDVIADVERLKLGVAADNLDPNAWAVESFEMAKRDAYNLDFEPVTVERPGSGEQIKALQVTLDADYGDAAKSDTKKRVRLGGHRLALILKDILTPLTANE